jgi:pimeloyl-ACP methyl ester carboxylesterase
MAMAERMVEANGVELCTESFGDPADPPILLVMGTGASMLWWEEEFCRLLAGGGRFVIRYDHRDTGRSTSYEPGRPEYSSADLVGDVARVLDGYAIGAAHVVGASMGGALGQLFALDYPERVASLTLMSTSRAVPGTRELPPMTKEYEQFLGDSDVDWADPAAVAEYVVADSRALAGDRPFDEDASRERARRDVRRARSFASVQNHGLLDGSEREGDSLFAMRAPTLVIHGTSDPLFPVEHGVALAEEIRGATLITLEGAGHILSPADWERVIDAIVEHTSS